MPDDEDIPEEITPETLAAARVNFKAFQQRDPAAAAKLDRFVEGPARLGDDPRLIKHFAKTSEAPSDIALRAYAIYPGMKP